MSENQPTRAVFRLPWEAAIFPLLLFVAATPLATWRPWLLWVYLIPLVALLWTLFTRTVVTTDSITTYGLSGRRRIHWSDFDRFEFRQSRWAIAVTTDEVRHRLPMIRPRDLPRLTAAAGGTLHVVVPTRTEPDTGEAVLDTDDVPDTTAVTATDDPGPDTTAAAAGTGTTDAPTQLSDPQGPTRE